MTNRKKDENVGGQVRSLFCFRLQPSKKAGWSILRCVGCWRKNSLKITRKNIICKKEGAKRDALICKPFLRDVLISGTLRKIHAQVPWFRHCFRIKTANSISAFIPVGSLTRSSAIAVSSASFNWWSDTLRAIFAHVECVWSCTHLPRGNVKYSWELGQSFVVGYLPDFFHSCWMALGIGMIGFF